MSLKPIFYQRNFSETTQPITEMRVDSISWDVIGGCREAKITATGETTALWNLVSLLRCAVVIQDAMERAAWWGYVNEVRVRIGGFEHAIALTDMANAVDVSYTSDSDRAQYRTGWALYQPSIDIYGRKSLLYSTNNASAAMAANKRAAILDAKAWPEAVTTFPASREKRSDAASATLVLRGWFATLDWRYATVSGTNTVETTTQIANLVTGYGAFFTGTIIDAASGISGVEWRDGETTVANEIIALLEMGGANGRRLLCDVLINRRLRVYEEPARTEVTYFIDRFGKLMTPLMLDVPEYQSPVGRWARAVNVIPASVETNRTVNPGMMFIEAARWTPDGGLKLQPRGIVKVADLFRGER